MLFIVFSLCQLKFEAAFEIEKVQMVIFYSIAFVEFDIIKKFISVLKINVDFRTLFSNLFGYCTESQNHCSDLFRILKTQQKWSVLDGPDLTF